VAIWRRARGRSQQAADTTIRRCKREKAHSKSRPPAEAGGGLNTRASAVSPSRRPSHPIPYGPGVVHAGVAHSLQHVGPHRLHLLAGVLFRHPLIELGILFAIVDLDRSLSLRLLMLRELRFACRPGLVVMLELARELRPLPFVFSLRLLQLGVALRIPGVRSRLYFMPPAPRQSRRQVASFERQSTGGRSSWPGACRLQAGRGEERASGLMKAHPGEPAGIVRPNGRPNTQNFSGPLANAFGRILNLPSRVYMMLSGN
jgi:hypothetical protein